MKSETVLASCVILAVIFPGLVHLIVPPKTPVLSGFEPAAIGSYRELVCDAWQPGAGTITYKWFKYSIANGVEDWETKGPIGSNQKYIFNPVTAEKDFHNNPTETESVSGKYMCRASNSAGARNSEWGDLYVYTPWSATELKMIEKSSVPITAGVGVTIKCESDSSNSGSPGTISWYRNGQQITTGVTQATRQASYRGIIYASELTFTARKEDNQAKYECKINDQANFRKDVTITVHFPPNGIQFSETSITVKEGVTKTITCSTTSSSNPAVSGVSVKKRLGSWAVDVTGTSRVTNGVYNGKDVSIDIKLDTNRKDNGAQYICSFTYASTTFRETATVNVQFNPSKITMTQKPPTSINEGKSLNIVCETDSANPVADIQFHRKRAGGTWEQLTSGITSEVRPGEYNGKIRKSTLTVTANRLDTQAVFKCEVKDGSFQMEQFVTVNVYFPPTVTISSNPKPVKEGDTLTLICTASGGNPTVHTYTWFYKNKEIPNETSKDYSITSIKYTQSGAYKCQVTNYSPDGKADASLDIDIQYKAKWNPDLPEVFTVASKPNTPMKFVLHVIANPPPTDVTWFLPNMTTIGGAFSVAKVNDTAYSLNKTTVGVNDYGNYTANVTNDVGVSAFVFELEEVVPPDTPCCLALVDATAVSLTLTFTSGFAGGSSQTFTIENRTSVGNVWDIVVKGIADPGFGNNVTQKISGLDSDISYEFRVKATNADGDSGYGKTIKAKTEAAPNVWLTVERTDNQVAASWPKLLKEYTKIQIKYCLTERESCDYHDVANPTSLKSTFTVKEGNIYTYSMIIFDGEDLVFVSAAVLAPTSGPPAGAIGGAVGGFLFLLVITAVVLATFFILKKRRAKEGRDSPPTGGDTAGLAVTPLTSNHIPDPVYVNIDNRAFESDADCLNKKEPVYINCPQNQPEGDDAGLAEPEYMEYDEPHQGCAKPKNDAAHQDGLGDQQERVQEVVYDDAKWTPSVAVAAVAKKKLEDISDEEFEQWLLSKQVTESTYQVLAKNGLNKAAIFALLQREEDLKALRIKPLGQEILVRNLVESFRTGAEAWLGDGLISHLGEAVEGVSVEAENPYEELNVTPDVIADQVYTKLKPWQFSRADC